MPEAAAAAEHGVEGRPQEDVAYAAESEDFSSLPTPPSVYDELSQLGDAPALYDEEGMVNSESESWDDGALPFDDDYDAYDERPRLTVVDDRYADLPPPPSANHPTQTIRDAAANFFDQDLA